MKFQTKDPEAVARRMMFLAYNAASVTGMGVFRARQGATEDEVWANVIGRGDYGGAGPVAKPGRCLADYVYGRMMKLRLEWDAGGVTCPDGDLNYEYQSWAGAYPTYQALFDAAVSDLTKT